MIRIIDARWRRHANELRLHCEACGAEWWHRADRWLAQCGCGIGENITALRDRYLAEEHGKRQ